MRLSAIHLCRNCALPLILLVVSGCSKEINDLYTFIETTKASNVGSVKPLPQFKPYESFSYSATDLRDPFEADINLEEAANVASNSLHPESNRPRQPLEMFPLDTLAMVGIMEQSNNTWGLIKDPQNVVHRVQLGNYMGQSDGRIVAISETDIHLVEIIPDGIGGYIEREASIAIGNE